MSERAPPPVGRHRSWLPFVDAFELVLRQVGDLDQALKDLESAQASGQVHSLLVARGVRRLMTRADFRNLQVEVPGYWDEDGRKKLAKEWRDQIKIELRGKPVLIFLWQPDLEEFLGLRPAAAREEAGPSEPATPEPLESEPPKAALEPEPEPEQPTRRPRRKTERAKQRLEVTLAIVRKHCPDHADEAPADLVRWVQDHVAPVDAVRWVRDDWKAEVEAREKTIQKLPCPGRTTIETDLGFQTRQSAAKRGKKVKHNQSVTVPSWFPPGLYGCPCDATGSRLHGQPTDRPNRRGARRWPLHA